MARTLGATLLAAQTEASRHPICDLVVGKGARDLPFPENTGFLVTGNVQQYNAPVMQTSGKLFVFYNGPGDHSTTGGLYLTMSDADRTQFGSSVNIGWSEGFYTDIIYMDAVQIDDAGSMGVVTLSYRNYSPSWYRMVQAYVVSASGVKVSSVSVWDIPGGETPQGVTVARTGTATYAIIYIKQDNKFYLRTSSNFTSWSAESELSIGGLTASRSIYNCKVIKLASGSYFLTFSYMNYVDDDGTITNIWYSTSADLSTWADALPLTASAEKNRNYYEPDLAQKSDGSLFVSLLESNSYLYMNQTTYGWTGRVVHPMDAWVDEVNQKLYLVGMTTEGCACIDLATWLIDKVFYYDSVPVIPAYYRNTNWSDTMQNYHGGVTGPYTFIGGPSGWCMMDFAGNTFRSFMFVDREADYGEDSAKNVNWTSVHGWSGWDQVPEQPIYDSANNRLYIGFAPPHIYDATFQFGYIDLDQSGPTYDFTDVITCTTVPHTNNAAWHNEYRLYVNEGLLITCGGNATYGGKLILWDLARNAVYKCYHYSEYSDFPFAGVIDAVLVGDTVYATVCYSSGPTETYKKWMLEIDLATDRMIYHYPPFTDDAYFDGSAGPTDTQYGTMFHIESTTELVIAGYAQPVVFNYTTKTWECSDYDEEGAGPNAGAVWEWFVYNETTDCFIGAKNNHALYMMPRSGMLNRIVYSVGTPSWTFTTPAILVDDYSVSKNKIARGTGDEVWSFWADSKVSTDNLSWGKTNAHANLEDYLTGEISVEWNIDGTPNKLNFTLSHGYLFDPQNTTSIMRYYLGKGNVAILKFGENVGSTEYWSNQGTFVITGISLKYKRGDYPTADITCEDLRVLWDQHQVPSTQLVSSYPEAGIQNTLIANTELELSDFDLPTFTDRFEFDAQWLDAYLKDIIEDIAGRFKYFIVVNGDNKITARRIDITAATDHAYTTRDQLIDFTPDDSFSDLTNRITITGQSLDDIEVLYAEERLGGLAGTIGWWGFNKDRTIHYSDDRSKRAKFPRLKVIESSTSIMFDLMGNITEQLTYVDPYHKYCVVTITAPNLIPVLIGALAYWAAMHFIFDYVEAGGIVEVFGITIPYGRMLESIGLMLVLNVLGSVANYQFDIYGQPVGYVKRDYSAFCDDLTLQQKIGMIVEQKHEGFICHTQYDCQYVADFEMLLARLQRNRVSFSKVTHLQDEVGDIITLPHPYNQRTMKLLITSLKRRYSAMKGDGHFIDEVEGWVL